MNIATCNLKTSGEKGNRGFTLVETLVATAILAMCFICLYTGVTFGVSVVSAARESSRATEILSEKLETIRLYDWVSMNSNGYVLPTFTAYYNPSIPSRPPTYRGTVAITSVPGTMNYVTNLKTVQVTLSWTNGNIPRQKQMSTYVSQYGLHGYE